MKEMTWNDTQALEALRVNINELVNEKCREYNDSYRNISYVDLCAMMVIVGYCGNGHAGEHNNLASVSNFLSIPYERALGILDHLVSYGCVQLDEPINDIKLSEKGLDFTSRYVEDNLFLLFRGRMFEAINLTLYPKPNSDEVIEPYNSLTNIEIAKNNCQKQIYENILELPYVWLCYMKLSKGFDLNRPYNKEKYDLNADIQIGIIGESFTKKDRNKEIARTIENVVNNVIMLPEEDRIKYITEDDLDRLIRSDYDHLTYVNGEKIKIEDPFREKKDKAYKEWLETEEGSRYK